MVIRIDGVDESNVRAHDVLAVLTEERRNETETVKRHIRCVERSEHWKALLDQVRPALALALGVGLLEGGATAHVEDVVADCSAEMLVLGPELVKQAGVERRAFAGIGGVGVGECANLFVGRIFEPDVFPEFLEIGVGGDVELCNQGEERASFLRES